MPSLRIDTPPPKLWVCVLGAAAVRSEQLVLQKGAGHF
jgi:hypothetical protein